MSEHTALNGTPEGDGADDQAFVIGGGGSGGTGDPSALAFGGGAEGGDYGGLALPDDDDDELAALERAVKTMEEEHRLLAMHQLVSSEEGVRRGERPSAGAAGPAVGGAASGEPQKNCSVFVGNLDPRTVEDELRLIFLPCGPIRRVTLLRDRASGQPKGTAYVEFESEESANKALIKDHQQLHGKPMKVAIKRDNVAGMGRAGAFGVGGGRGGRGGAMSQQAMMMQMMGQMMAQMQRGGGSGGMPPFRGRGGPPRGRGAGRGGQ